MVQVITLMLTLTFALVVVPVLKPASMEQGTALMILMHL